MSEGTCFCGAVGIKYTGEIQAKALCHCADCKKISGGAYSVNIIVPEDGFSVTKGSPKSISKKADSGSSITSYFCGDCGTTLYRDGETFKGAKIVKAGVLDGKDALDVAAPGVELFSSERPSWLPAISGAAQKTAMPNSDDA